MNNDKMIIKLYEDVLKVCLEHFQRENSILADSLKETLRIGESMKNVK